MIGSHLVKSWSTTQSTISLSSGEAEHYGVVKAVGMGLGVQEFMKDMGVYMALRVHTDSSAARGIVKRVGLGTQRHIATNQLWVQEKLRKKKFQLLTVKGKSNPADLFTKHLPAETMKQCLHFMGAEFREGRPAAAPQVKDHEDIIAEELDDSIRDEVTESWHRGLWI